MRVAVAIKADCLSPPLAHTHSLSAQVALAEMMILTNVDRLIR
jgi:hypothetical protein